MEKINKMLLKNGCGICGGKMIKIRPSYPKGEARVVCPTCLADKMENINKISNIKDIQEWGYGYQEK